MTKDDNFTEMINDLLIQFMIEKDINDVEKACLLKEFVDFLKRDN